MARARVKFDRFMVDVENGGNVKLARLTDAEYRCHFAGVLPIAAKSPIRGLLLIGDSPATAADVAFQARRPERVAAAAMRKLREIGILLPNLEFGCEQIHDFEDWNPLPVKDTTAAERQARRRDRLKADRDDHGGVTGKSRVIVTQVTGTEEEGEEGERTPSPREGVVAQADAPTWAQQATSEAMAVFGSIPASSLASRGCPVDVFAVEQAVIHHEGKNFAAAASRAVVRAAEPSDRQPNLPRLLGFELSNEDDAKPRRNGHRLSAQPASSAALAKARRRAAEGPA